MRKDICIPLLAMSFAAAVSGNFGYLIGSTTRIVACASDFEGCTNVCENNGGVELLRSYALCSCENGALFDMDDLRK